MPWLLLLIPLPGLVAFLKAKEGSGKQRRALTVLEGECGVAITLYIARVLGAF